MELRSLAEKLNQLEEEQNPVWGKMSAQHMVEHLTTTLLLATGKVKVAVYTPDKQLAQMRAFLMSDRALPRGVVSPAIGSELPALRNESYDLAFAEFWKEYDRFETYYKENPEGKHVNPAFGVLNYDEWKQFMKKHFTHHFTQFALLPE